MTTNTHPDAAFDGPVPAQPTEDDPAGQNGSATEHPNIGTTAVVPLNDAAALFAALAAGIQGSAVGWSPQAVQQLEVGLTERYGSSLGDDRAVERLIALAQQPTAA